MKTRVRVHLPIWRLPAKSNKTNDNPAVNRQQATGDRRQTELAIGNERIAGKRRAKTKTMAQGAINNSKTLYNDSNKEHDEDLAHPIHQHR